MILDINEHEKELLVAVLKSEHVSLHDELRHTESYDYKQMLKQKDELLQNLRSRIETEG